MGINTKREKGEKEQLANDQGKSYEAALEKMKEDDVHDSKAVDDYIISLACEDAEGMYEYNSEGKLEWFTPTEEENQHVEIVVQDRKDHRFLPSLTVLCTIHDDNNYEIAQLEIPFIWHPFLFHYGINTTIPKEGEYTCTVTIKKPQFHRHDEEVGKRYENDVTVTLGPVHLTLGKKPHGPE